MVGRHPILDNPKREWDDILALNLRGAFLVAKAAAKSMVDRKTAGKIVFTSPWVQDVPWLEITPYTVTKAEMKTLARGTARELAVHGIAVNASAPV
jgi:gluconate 5-dehydrogenase